MKTLRNILPTQVMLFSCVCFVTICSQALAQTSTTPAQAIIRYDSIHHPVVAQKGMVVSQRQIASDIGRQILAQGGNAVDAGVAVGYALAVLLPRAGNIGGGGFMLIHLAESQKTIAIDYRERAPAAAHQDLFLDSKGDVDPQLERFSHLAVGVPGTVAGLSHALEKYGTLPLAQVMAPAIELAERGFVMDYDTASAIALRVDHLKRHPATANKLFKAGAPYEPGDVFKQPILAKTLKTISDLGPKGFYEGKVANQLIAEMQANQGIMTHADLKAYQPTERPVLKSTYRSYDVVSMPPPSSGGVHLLQMLNVLEHFDLKQMGIGSAESLHVLAETMKLAYADRSQHLGDPDYHDVPVDWLLSKTYAKTLASRIKAQRATPSEDIAPGSPDDYESDETTHFSVIDNDGNVVANTYTLNFSFGTGITVAGFILNNEMADFTAKPGVPDAFGLMGSAANAIKPGKRPLSSMTPTIVFKDNQPFLITGSPGGSRIITAVLQQVVNVLEHEVNLATATHLPRIHHQWYPDTLFYEAGTSVDTLHLLRQWGHTVEQSGTMGSLQSILWDGQQYLGADDPRRPGAGVAPLN